MKKYILSLFLVIFNITILNANEHIKLFCSDSIEKRLSINLDSDKLNLTQDAVQDNTGGYVDIPEDRYYLKTKDKLYYLNGVVEYNYKNKINQFRSYIDNNSEKFITIKELYSLKNSKGLKLIQKIILDNKNKVKDSQYKTITNIINVYFDEKLFQKEYYKCKK
ncbi:MAG: hypothetical protein U9R16_07200 [Campylobacterota bacterium]|nr:hypothetical protein [Campylobacterota bacterium]